jgi:glycosyltransferase involved in cell wall biosynthesis
MDADLKILQITPYYLPYTEYGGPVYTVSYLCDSLVDYGLKVTLYTTYKKVKERDPYTIISDRIDLHYFHSYFSSRLFFAPNLIFSLLRNIKKYDVVHLHMWWNLTSMLSMMIAVFYKRTVILSPRGNLSEYTLTHSKSFIKKIFHRLYNRYVFRKTILHATTEAELEECRKIADWKLEVVIPNLVKIPRQQIEIRKRLPGEPMKLLFISRIDSKKGLELLMGALARVGFPCMLTIAGNGTDKYISELKLKAAKLGIHDKIEWVGFANDKQKQELYTHHDLLVLPSYNENFANVVVESLALGTPVLVSDKVGLCRFVEKNKLGWVCKTDEDDILAKLEMISQSPVSREEASQAAPAAVAREFNREQLVDRYLDLYVLA